MAAGPSDCEEGRKLNTEPWKLPMDAVQTACALVTVITGVGGVVVLRRSLYPEARAVRLLHPILRRVGGPLEAPVVHLQPNPYAQLTPTRAVILQGRNKEGKTTQLRTAIPWWRRWGPLAYRGIYMDGAKGTATEGFDIWVTVQMYGNRSTGGSEVAKALDDFCSAQWVRLTTEKLFGKPQPQPAIVIVDQFEQLLKKYPQPALEWANDLANSHVRDNLARIIFVVNSDAGARTLLNLNQGDRFERVILEPATGEEARRKGIEVDYFTRCQMNIGLYKLARGRAIPEGEVETYASRTIARWAEDFQVPYPLKYDRSWREVSEATMKKKLLHALEGSLVAEVDDDGQPAHTEEAIKEALRRVQLTLEFLNASEILGSMEGEWQAILMNRGTHQDVAKALSRHIRQIIGNPMKK